jgi:hypothetical protein
LTVDPAIENESAHTATHSVAFFSAVVFISPSLRRGL